jgi:hypothetical protein
MLSKFAKSNRVPAHLLDAGVDVLFCDLPVRDVYWQF